MAELQSFTMKRDRDIGGTRYASAGDTVFHFTRYDYGSASDDTHMLGVPHRSVTLDPTGDYPFFTVPSADMEPRP